MLGLSTCICIWIFIALSLPVNITESTQHRKKIGDTSLIIYRHRQHPVQQYKKNIRNINTLRTINETFAQIPILNPLNNINTSNISHHEEERLLYLSSTGKRNKKRSRIHALKVFKFSPPASHRNVSGQQYFDKTMRNPSQNVDELEILLRKSNTDRSYLKNLNTMEKIEPNSPVERNILITTTPNFAAGRNRTVSEASKSRTKLPNSFDDLLSVFQINQSKETDVDHVFSNKPKNQFPCVRLEWNVTINDHSSLNINSNNSKSNSNKKTLLDYGKFINDPYMLDQDSNNDPHVRIKRDGESIDEQVSNTYFNSNYFEDLMNSFPRNFHANDNSLLTTDGRITLRQESVVSDAVTTKNIISRDNREINIGRISTIIDTKIQNNEKDLFPPTNTYFDLQLKRRKRDVPKENKTYKTVESRKKHGRKRINRKNKRGLTKRGVPKKTIKKRIILYNDTPKVNKFQVGLNIEKKNSGDILSKVNRYKANVPGSVNLIDVSPQALISENQSIISPCDEISHNSHNETLHISRNGTQIYEQHQNNLSKSYVPLPRTKRNKVQEDNSFTEDASLDQKINARIKRNGNLLKATYRDDNKDNRELNYYEDIREPETVIHQRDIKNESVTTTEKPRANRAAKSIEEIKELAEKLVAKVNELQNYLSNNAVHKETRNKKEATMEEIDTRPKNVTVGYVIEELPRVIENCVPLVSLNSSTGNVRDGTMNLAENISNNKRVMKLTRRLAKQEGSTVNRSPKVSAGVLRVTRKEGDQRNRKSRRKWGRWTDWSSCSVTCGKGRQIRWRHCIHDCSVAETEMEEKACQLPACPPGKFLGIF